MLSVWWWEANQRGAKFLCIIKLPVASRKVSVVFILYFLLLVLREHMCLWEKCTSLCISFFLVCCFAVILSEIQNKTFRCSIPEEELKINFKSLCRKKKTWCSFLLADTEVNTRKKTFTEVQTERLEQAERTVLIKCPSRLNEKKLLQYLSSHGKINSHFFFENRVSY